MTDTQLPADVDAAARAFDGDGLVVLDACLPVPLVGTLHEAAVESLERCRARIREAGLTFGVGMENGFSEIVERVAGRFDLTFGTDGPPYTHPLVAGDAPWSPLIGRLLGPDAPLLYRGLLVAAPGAVEQPWHADGDHLDTGSSVHLPAHCLNVFVPLVDLTPDNGPTELCPGSHRLTGGLKGLYRQDGKLPERIGYRGTPVTPLLSAGSALVFDYRLVHRARQNRSAALRPVLYLTYARLGFTDTHSFPARSLAPNR